MWTLLVSGGLSWQRVVVSSLDCSWTNPVANGGGKSIPIHAIYELMRDFVHQKNHIDRRSFIGIN